MQKSPAFKVLIVDDEPLSSHVIQSAVVDAGFEPIFVDSAVKALDFVTEASREIVAIISDLRMPGEDGLALRAKLLPQYRDLPFIVHSGFVSRDLALQGVELKIAAFLDKPATDAAVKAILLREAAPRAAQLMERQAIEQTFFAEARSILEELEPLILSLEDNPNDGDVINAIFRKVHTLKGSSGILDTDVFYKFVHRFEDMLSRLKKREISVSNGVVSAMLRGYDVVKTMITSLEARDGKVFELQSLLEQIAIGDRSGALNEASQKSAAAPARPNTDVKVDTIKVTTKTLDEFMELSGEITVIRNMVNKLVRAIEKNQPGNKDISLLAELLEEMHKINSSLQGRIVDLRKVSVATSMRPLKRTIRDLSASLGKGLELVTGGEDLKIDTAISQVLSDSLIHLIRNSADHGIEPTDERVAAGKSPSGKIKVVCTEDHDEVIVTVADDGRGIDPERVKKKLIDGGKMTREEVNALSRQQLLSQIFESGFSTAATVSDVSGRGVGMDMVKTSVERARGRIDIATDQGVGTTFTLRLPVPKSVLIISSLLVTADEQTFAIPQDGVVRLLQLSQTQAATQIAHLEGGSVLRMDDKLIPLADLRALLGLKQQRNLAQIDDYLCIVVAKGDNGIFGLIVDSILDGEEVVVKPIGKHLETLHCFGGATFFGDGHVGLILDVNGIERFAKIGGAGDRKPLNGGDLSKPNGGGEHILFSLKHGGCFGVPLQQVYRLEEVPAANVRYSGRQPVAIYRGTILPLYRLDSLLGFEEAPEDSAPETLSVLVFEHSGRRFGLIVKTIEDIVVARSEIDQNIRDRVGIAGNIFVGDETVCIVDFEVLLASHGLIAVHESTESEAAANVLPFAVPAPRIVAEPSTASASGWGVFD